MSEILVSALGDEHRDREWVDAYGNHWAWIDDRWWWRLSPEESRHYPPGFHATNWTRPPVPEAVNERRRGFDYGPGPFMEAVHHRAVYGTHWGQQ